MRQKTEHMPDKNSTTFGDESTNTMRPSKDAGSKDKEKEMNGVFTEAVRRWIYAVAAALGAAAIFYGIMTAEEVAIWLGVLIALLGGLAVSNVGEKGLDT